MENSGCRLTGDDLQSGARTFSIRCSHVLNSVFARSQFGVRTLRCVCNFRIIVDERGNIGKYGENAFGDG